jgi:hypothetical protein
MALVERSALRIANELGLEQLNLMPVIEPNLDSYYDCFHLPPYGANAVASAVADTLFRKSSADRASPRFSRPLVAMER